MAKKLKILLFFIALLTIGIFCGLADLLVDKDERNKTYRNENLGYEIKYPDSWFVEESTRLIANIRPKKEYMPEEGVSIRVLLTREDWSQYSCLYEDEDVWIGVRFCGWLGSYESLGEINIGDIKAHSIRAVPDPNYKQINSYKTVFMKKGDAVYEISFYDGQDQVNIVNQIIFTFKFTK